MESGVIKKKVNKSNFISLVEARILEKQLTEWEDFLNRFGYSRERKLMFGNEQIHTSEISNRK